MIKSKIKIFSGLLLLFFGFAIIFTSLAGMTGFAISENLSTSLNAVLGLIPIIAGLIIIFSEMGIEKYVRRLDQIITSGSVGDYGDLRKIASKMGYDLEEGTNHTDVRSGGRLITQIPRHAHGTATGTYRSIAKALKDNSA